MATASLRSSLILCGTLFALMIALAIVGNVLQRSGMVLTGVRQDAVAALFFGLFLAFGFSAVPVIVKVVLGAQVRLGNQDVAAVAAALRQQRLIIWAIWGLMTAGLIIAVPAAMMGGAFGDGPSRAINRMFAGRPLGRLCARPDMTVDDMVKQSTITLDIHGTPATISGSGVLDFCIPGTTIALTGARYYMVTTYTKDPARVRAIDIGTSPEKQSIAAIDSADAALRAQLLVADGWLAGHEVYRTEEDRTLHSGASEGPEGTLWSRDGMVFNIERKRMDDEKPDEDRATAGEWIQFIALWPQQDYPYIERYVFQPPKGIAR